MNKPNEAIKGFATIYQDEMNWLENADIFTAASGFEFAEGAAWHPRGFFLFSDTPANKIYRLSTSGEVTVYLNKSGLYEGRTTDLSDQAGSNGIAIDSNENILICQHGNHAIAKLYKDVLLSTLVNEYQGRPFNSPNDLLIHSDGTIYFTDPPYGLEGQVLHPGKFQPVAGVYQYKSGITRLFGTELQYPNGLFFSPGEQYLFVSSNHPCDPGILRYRLSAHVLPRYEGIFMEQHADGMTRGEDGRIYLATDEGVLVVSADGRKLALITLPESPSNLCWGGMKGEILLVTARSGVYFIVRKL